MMTDTQHKPLKMHSSPHIRQPVSVSRTMLTVSLATLPAVLTLCITFGWGILINILLSMMFALAAESTVLWLRKKPIKQTLSDYSALLSALLFALCLPPTSPWWLTAIGISFAIIVAKHLYGGLGFNPFNPAMAGYVLVLVTFPTQMTAWVAPAGLTESTIGFWDTLLLIFSGETSTHLSADAVSMATPLDTLKNGWNLGETTTEIMASNLVFSGVSGVGWFWVNGAYLLGGLILIRLKIITWHIPVGLLSGVLLTSSFFYLTNPDGLASPLLHRTTGATMIGAFFIATDPVSAATSNQGRLIYGFLIGLLTYVIRTWGGYPDGIAFSILLMNLCVPMLDYYTQPRTYGHARGEPL